VQQGFNALLQGSGLELQPSGSGYSLRRALAAGSATLPEVRVTASADETTTEGTGSYTTRAVGTATKLALSPRETPQSISVVTRQQMDDQGMMQLTDAFRQVTGVSFTQQGSQGTDSNAVYSRGFPVENYQIDGVPQLNSWVLQSADLALYDRVEVLRGATGLLNGVGSPAATVNLVRKRPTSTFQGTASVTLGSWNLKRTDIDVAGPLTEAGNVRGRFVAALQDNDSFIDRLKEKKEIFYGALDIDLSRATKLTLGLDHQRIDADGQGRSGFPLLDADGSLSSFSRSANSGANWAYSHQLHRSAFVALDHQFDNEWILKANVSQSRRKYDDVVGYAGGGALDTSNGSGLSLWSNRWGAEYVQNALDIYASGPFEFLGRKHELVVGYNVSRTTYDAPWYNGSWWWAMLPIPNYYKWDGNTPGEPAWAKVGMTNFEEKQSGLYSTARFRPTDQLSIFAGARVSNWEQTTVGNDWVTGTKESSTRKESGVVTPYIGAVYDISKQWSVYASYTDIFKPQNNRGLDRNYLAPKTGTNAEVGLKSAFFDNRLNFSAAYFHVKEDNLAVQIVPPVVVPGGFAYRAENGAKTTGYELEVSGEPIRNWNISAGYTQRSSRSAEGESLNTDAPNNMFKMFTTYRLASVGNGLIVGGGARWQGDVYTEGRGPGGERFTQEAYTVVDLMARYPLSKDVTLSANLNNVFDKEYYTSTTSAYYGMPRNVRVNLSYKF
jgi:outer membrane receptor for ferric coprogen and ferric-rhodotorulic acid